MGTVYRARDPILDRLVALKTVSPGLLSKQDTLMRFQREARAAARLQHTNIVTIYELGEVGGTLFIAMELLEGMDLAQAMFPANRFPLDEKLRMMVDVCRGLDYAHKGGVIHRDVKPANIRVLTDGSVKLVDFGIARLADSTMTQTGLVLGTPSYIAPEVLKSGQVDHRADMWAAGVILYEIVAGKRPFESATIASLAYSIVHERPPPLDPAALKLPAGLTDVIGKALHKLPGERYVDMAEMARAIEEVIGVSRPGEAPLPAEDRKKAYTRNFEEARRLLTANDLERALEAARRAQALDPSQSAILALIQVLEERLEEAPTLPPARRGQTVDLPLVPIEDDRTAPAPPRVSPTDSADALTVRTPRAVPAEPPKPVPTPVLTQLRLRGAAVFRELAIFGEPPSTQGACLSPVRDILVASGTDGAIRVWDLHSRTRVLMLRTEMHQRIGHDAMALCMAFSPDGVLLASGHVDGSVHLWNIATGEEVQVKLRHEGLVGALAFAPDGSVLASGGMDANLKLWDVGLALAGEARRTLHRQPAGVTALCYAGGGAYLVTGHASRILRLLDAASGRLVATLRGPEALVSLLCLAPDGRRLAVASHDRTIRLFDLESRSQIFVVGAHRKPTTALSFFADGVHLATVAQDNAVHIWDLEARSTLAALWGPADESFTGVALFGARDHIAVALADGRIRTWGPSS